MSDTYTLQLKNFRSIQEASVDIAPLTVIYGPNGSGKSSIIYGLLTLKGFLTNPNQNIPSLFSYPTISLGGCEEVVWKHDLEKQISIDLLADTLAGRSEYRLAIEQSGGESTINVTAPGIEDGLVLPMSIPFPYQVNQEQTFEIDLSDEDTNTEVIVSWNGMLMSHRAGYTARPEYIAELLHIANLPIELAKGTGFVPLRRGFGIPTYTITNITPALSTDTEVASLLADDRYLEYEVSRYAESVAKRQVRTRTQIGTSTFTIDCIPTDGGVPTSIVNDGFGINQLVYMLTICLYSKTKIVTIEEPEIHLHPSMVRSLAHAMVDISSKTDKRFLISTHSEAFVLALLALVAEERLNVNNVSLLLATKEGMGSRFTKQDVKSNGQVEGGLDAFIASGFQDIEAFLKLTSE